jgi:hypothetical protein
MARPSHPPQLDYSNYIWRNRNGKSMNKQPFMTNPGKSSYPADVEDFSLLKALQTCALETGARNENSE